MRFHLTGCVTAIAWVLLGPMLTRASDYPFSMPSVIEAGASVVIKGAFDGDSANTRISVGGVPGIIENETRTECTFAAPSASIGRQGIEVRDGISWLKSDIVVLQVTPKLERTNLSRGETTRLELKVNGLDGLMREVELEITNETPSQISIDDGDQANVTLRPGPDTTVAVKIKAKQSGNFSIGYTVAKNAPAIQLTEVESGEGAEADSVVKVDCGGIKGKVINKTKFKFKAIVVHVTSACDLCEPKPPCPKATVTYSDSGAHPSFFVIPAGCPVTLLNGYEKEIDEGPRIIPNPIQEKPRTYDTEILRRGDSATITPTRTGRFLIDSDIHKHTDGYMFVAANTCYAVADSAGNYYIGELHPGEYTLEVFTQQKKTDFPKATVTVKANEVTTQDFVLERK